MEYFYILKLAKTFNSQTHVGVTEHIWDTVRLKVTGEYGELLTQGFVSAEGMLPFREDIRGEHLEDLKRESLAAGRPESKEGHNMDEKDVAAWLAEDRRVVQARIEEHRAASEEDP